MPRRSPMRWKGKSKCGDATAATPGTCTARRPRRPRGITRGKLAKARMKGLRTRDAKGPVQYGWQRDHANLHKRATSSSGGRNCERPRMSACSKPMDGSHMKEQRARHILQALVQGIDPPDRRGTGPRLGSSARRRPARAPGRCSGAGTDGRSRAATRAIARQRRALVERERGKRRSSRHSNPASRWRTSPPGTAAPCAPSKRAWSGSDCSLRRSEVPTIASWAPRQEGASSSQPPVNLRGCHPVCQRRPGNPSSSGLAGRRHDPAQHAARHSSPPLWHRVPVDWRGSWTAEIYRSHRDVARVHCLRRYTLSFIRPHVVADGLGRCGGRGPIRSTSARRPPRKLARIRRLLKAGGIDPARCLFITEDPTCHELHWVDRLISFGRLTPPALRESDYPWPSPEPLYAPRLEVSASERAECDAWIATQGWSGRPHRARATGKSTDDARQ